MNKALSFVRLDYITVKPYLTLKNLFIFLAVAVIMVINSGSSASAIGILMVYAALYVSYPFAVGEKNGIDALYTTLSIKRNTVVLGRYLFALTVDVCSGLLAYVFSFVIMLMLRKEFNAGEAFLVTLIMLLVFSVVQAIQLPIYFKLGYAKAKFIAYLPFFCLPLATVAATSLLKNVLSVNQITVLLEWLVANTFIMVLLGIALWLAIVIISFLMSLKYYNKREL